MLWGHLERLTGIEPAYQAWEASALPLSYSRSGTGLNSSRESRSTRFTLPQSRAFSEQVTRVKSRAAHPPLPQMAAMPLRRAAISVNGRPGRPRCPEGGKPNLEATETDQ